MRVCNCIVMCLAMVTNARAQFVEVFSDDFDDQNINEYVEFDIIGQILTQTTGVPTTFHEITFPNGGVRITSPPTPDPAFGPARSGFEQQTFGVADFDISVDVIDRANLTNAGWCVSARTREVGPGTTDGYFFCGINTEEGTGKTIFALDLFEDELFTVLADTGVPPNELVLDPNIDLRVNFRGVGNSLTASVFDLSDLTTPIATLSATDDTLTQGFTGLAAGAAGPPDMPDFSAFGDVTFDNYSVSLDPTLGSPFFPFVEEFDGPIDDDMPVTWQRGLMANGTTEVTEGNFVLSGSSYSTVVFKDRNAVFAQDSSAQARLQLGGTNPFAFATIYSRSPVTGEAYFGGIQKGGNIFVGELFADGSADFIQSDTTLSPESRDVILQFDTIGNGVSVSAWDAEDGKPDSPPSLSITDDTLTDGAFGLALGGGDASEATFRSFRIVTPLAAGDADQDTDFDQIDLVQVQVAAKYLSGQRATWGEGDWDGAPGGEPGNPPSGNGLFDQLDIVAALGAGKYLTGPYAAVGPNGQPNDGQTSIVYNAGTGEIGVDAPAGAELTSINIDSASGIFTGTEAENLGGSFDNDVDTNIFKATFGGSFGSLSFGNVAQSGLPEEFVLGDLSVVGSLAGGGDLGNVDLVYVPEPSTALLLAMGLVIGLTRIRHAKH